MTELNNLGGGLIRRYIQLRSGNRAWRMVKPDNPNIIDPQPDTPDRPVAAPVAAPAPKPAEPRKFAQQGMDACCGGSILLPEPDLSDSPDAVRAAAKAFWDTHYKRRQQANLETVSRYEKDLKVVNEGSHKRGPSTGYSKADLEYYIRTYKQRAEAFDFETMFAKGSLNLGKHRYDVDFTHFKSNGLTVSSAEFPGSTQTPAGLWVRDDYPFTKSGGHDLTDALVETPEPADVPDVKSEHNSYVYGRMIEPGFHILTGCDRANLANEIAGYIKTDKSIKVGDVVFWVVARYQMTQVKANKLAAAGFRCALKTGNKSHPGDSILYMYEHKVTEQDKNR